MGWVVSFTLLPYSPRGNSPLYQLYRRLGGPQSWAVPVIEPQYLSCPGHSLVVIQTELSGLRVGSSSDSCLISTYYWSDQIEDDERFRASSTHDKRNARKIMVGNSERMRTLGGPSLRYEDILKGV
jgi:hypothetical protein